MRLRIMFDRVTANSVTGARLGGIFFLSLVALVVFWSPWHSMYSLAQPKDETAGQQLSHPSDRFVYMGAASCSASACHGSTTPRHTFESSQNEHYIWSEKGPHAKAHESLTTPDAKIMGKHLNIAAPEKSDRCLSCHSLTVPADLQSKLYDVKDGVSCEACHGPAEKWLGAHTRRDWDAKKGATLGMVNTKDMVARAVKCLGCHAGAAGKMVNHELIAAGHPRLKFELDTYTYAMPPHWRKSKKAHDRGARAWAIGQATAFDNEIQLLRSSWQSRGALWPDFSRLDCFACHRPVVDHLRDLTDEEKAMQLWRVRNYDGRKPGGLVWNTSSDSAFHSLVNHLSAEDGKALDQLIRGIHRGLTDATMKADAFASTMTRLSELSGQLVSQVSPHTFTPQDTLTLMTSISGDGRHLSRAGFQAAEQAVLALASLYDAFTEAAGPSPDAPATKETVDALFKHIEDSKSFNPAHFEASMTKLHSHFSKIKLSKNKAASTP